MRPVRVAIVDDEEPARAAVRVLLRSHADLEVVAECRNGQEAVDVIRWMSIDLVLLDVQMPGLDGFQVVEAVGPDVMPATIFVTAYDQYALRAFDAAAVDYLLKPFDAARFEAALVKARRLIGSVQAVDWPARLSRVTSQTPAKTVTTPVVYRLPVPGRDRLTFLNVDEIDWIEASDQYVTVHAGARRHLLRRSLRDVLSRLPAGRFAQVHRSSVVHVGKIKELVRVKRGDAWLILTTGHQVRLSRRFRDGLRDTLGVPL